MADTKMTVNIDDVLADTGKKYLLRIEEMGLPLFTVPILQEKGIHFAAQLAERSTIGLRGFSPIGEAAAAQIEKAVEKIGLTMELEIEGRPAPKTFARRLEKAWQALQPPPPPEITVEAEPLIPPTPPADIVEDEKIEQEIIMSDITPQDSQFVDIVESIISTNRRDFAEKMLGQHFKSDPRNLEPHIAAAIDRLILFVGTDAAPLLLGKLGQQAFLTATHHSPGGKKIDTHAIGKFLDTAKHVKTFYEQMPQDRLIEQGTLAAFKQQISFVRSLDQANAALTETTRHLNQHTNFDNIPSVQQALETTKLLETAGTEMGFVMDMVVGKADVLFAHMLENFTPAEKSELFHFIQDNPSVPATIREAVIGESSRLLRAIVQDPETPLAKKISAILKGTKPIPLEMHKDETYLGDLKKLVQTALDGAGDQHADKMNALISMLLAPESFVQGIARPMAENIFAAYFAADQEQALRAEIDFAGRFQFTGSDTKLAERLTKADPLLAEELARRAVLVTTNKTERQKWIDIWGQMFDRIEETQPREVTMRTLWHAAWANIVVPAYKELVQKKGNALFDPEASRPAEDALAGAGSRPAAEPA